MLKRSLTTYLSLKLPKPLRFIIIIMAEPLICFYRACRDGANHYAKMALKFLSRDVETMEKLSCYCACNLEMAKIIKKRGGNMFITIEKACAIGCLPVVEMLKDEYFIEVCLRLCIKGGHLEVFKLLAPKAYYLEGDLGIAIDFGQFHIFNAFSKVPLEKFGHAVKFTTEKKIYQYYRSKTLNYSEKNDLMRWVAYTGSVKILKLLFSNTKPCVYEIIHRASNAGQTDILDYIWCHYERTFLKNKSIILEITVTRGYLHVVEFLISKDIDFGRGFIKKMTALAIKHGHFPLVDELEKLID